MMDKRIERKLHPWMDASEVDEVVNRHYQDLEQDKEEEHRYRGRRVENLGENVEEWSEKTGNGSSTIDICESHAKQLDKNPHRFDGILLPYNGDPVGTDGWGGDCDHPNYDDFNKRCPIPDCKVLLGGW